MANVAVIGAGVSGLAAAYYLSRAHRVTVFERDTRIGGHTHTVDARSRAGPVAVDTGFIVYNERTYPLFCRLLDELGVATQASDMSFGVGAADGSFEYSSRGLRGFFAQRGNVLNPRHYALFAEILRFNRQALGMLRPGANEASNETLGELLDRGRFGALLRERYLYPMTAAVWSMKPGAVAGFPAETLLRFFDNHGLLGINTHPQWRTIKGGSREYLAPLTKPYAERIHADVDIGAVRRNEVGVTIEIAGQGTLGFDEVVFACHGDQVLPMLADATALEREVIGQFRTSRNEACLHTDRRMLPRREDAWASWNCRVATAEWVDRPVVLTYHMNRLQKLAVQGKPVPENYCVTLNAGTNPGEGISADSIVKSMVYEHPIYDAAAVAAQGRWTEISGRAHTHFCGAYWFNGFHEDGVRSAARVAEALGVRA